MENSIEKPIEKTAKVCFEKVGYNEKIKEFEADGNKKEIPQYRITMLEGEMSIKIEEYTGIRENGITLSRFDNSLEKTMMSKAISASESKKATKRFMEEKGLKSIKEIIKDSKEQHGEIARDTADIDR